MRAGHNAHYVVGRAELAVLPGIVWKFYLAKNGAPGVIRTRDPRIRSPMLYPAELRALYLEFNMILDH